mgnify:CR=1 FL=1
MYPGSLEREPDRRGLPRPPLAMNEAILMGIGQGPITWTPLHAADTYATIARSGVKLTPRLRADVPQSRTDLKLDRAAVRQALEGLRRSANEQRGTTHHLTIPERPPERIFNAPGAWTWAKSGTADAPAFELQSDEEGQIKYDADHAWCVLLAGEGETPKYAISVVVEHGGSGGRVAGRGERMHAPTLMQGHLRQNMGGRTEAIKAERRAVARERQRAIADQPRA